MRLDKQYHLAKVNKFINNSELKSEAAMFISCWVLGLSVCDDGRCFSLHPGVLVQLVCSNADRGHQDSDCESCDEAHPVRTRRDNMDMNVQVCSALTTRPSNLYRVIVGSTGRLPCRSGSSGVGLKQLSPEEENCRACKYNEEDKCTNENLGHMGHRLWQRIWAVTLDSMYMQCSYICQQYV